MTIKQRAIESIKDLPETATWEDVLYQIQFIQAVEEGSREVNEGNVVAHAQVKQELQHWITG